MLELRTLFMLLKALYNTIWKQAALANVLISPSKKKFTHLGPSLMLVLVLSPLKYVVAVWSIKELKTIISQNYIKWHTNLSDKKYLIP